LAENDWGGLTVAEFRGSHGMEEGKGERYLASGGQYGNALLGVRHQAEEDIGQHCPLPASTEQLKVC